MELGVLALLVSSLAYGVNQINTTNFVGSLISIHTWPFLVAAVLLSVLVKFREGLMIQ